MLRNDIVPASMSSEKTISKTSIRHKPMTLEQRAWWIKKIALLKLQFNNEFKDQVDIL
jgi:hypothetical protein